MAKYSIRTQKPFNTQGGLRGDLGSDSIRKHEVDNLLYSEHAGVRPHHLEKELIMYIEAKSRPHIAKYFTEKTIEIDLRSQRLIHSDLNLIPFGVPAMEWVIDNLVNKNQPPFTIDEDKKKWILTIYIVSTIRWFDNVILMDKYGTTDVSDMDMYQASYSLIKSCFTSIWGSEKEADMVIESVCYDPTLSGNSPILEVIKKQEHRVFKINQELGMAIKYSFEDFYAGEFEQAAKKWGEEISSSLAVCVTIYASIVAESGTRRETRRDQTPS